jgi:hypothetical protein
MAKFIKNGVTVYDNIDMSGSTDYASLGARYTMGRLDNLEGRFSRYFTKSEIFDVLGGGISTRIVLSLPGEPEENTYYLVGSDEDGYVLHYFDRNLVHAILGPREVDLDKFAHRTEELEEPNVANVGEIWQYVGPHNVHDFMRGEWYECQQVSLYGWIDSYGLIRYLKEETPHIGDRLYLPTGETHYDRYVRSVGASNITDSNGTVWTRNTAADIQPYVWVHLHHAEMEPYLDGSTRIGYIDDESHMNRWFRVDALIDYIRHYISNAGVTTDGWMTKESYQKLDDIARTNGIVKENGAGDASAATASDVVTTLGVTPVNRATADANGNDIAATYATKGEAGALDGITGIVKATDGAASAASAADIVGAIGNTAVNRSTADAAGNDIAATYATKAEAGSFSGINGIVKMTTSGSTSTASAATASDVVGVIGNTAVMRATADADGNTISSTYATATDVQAIKGVNGIIKSNGTTPGSATASDVVSLLGTTPVNRATADKNGDDIAVTYATKDELEDKADETHVHAASDITSGTLDAARIPSLDASKIGTGTLPIARGGTGLSASPSMLVNLGATIADDVLKASPRPGITGTLGVNHGGTGVATITGIVKGNGTTAFSAATASDVVTLLDETPVNRATGDADGNAIASTYVTKTAFDAFANVTGIVKGGGSGTATAATASDVVTLLGNTPVNRATADAAGDAIATTYVKKTDTISNADIDAIVEAAFA